MMEAYYIDYRQTVGYVVCRMTDTGVEDILNFGDRQSDAFEFRNDCNHGRLTSGRIRLLSRIPVTQRCKYLGNGNVRRLPKK